MASARRLHSRYVSGRVIGFFALAVAASGLPSQAQSHSHGYLVVAPAVLSSSGESSAALQASGGGEGVFPGGVGLGAEIGALRVRGNSDTVVGIVSANGYFHIPRPLSSFDPYLTAGYSAVIDLFDSTNMFNIGGGTNWWFAPHLGLKLEFRDHLHSGNESSNLATFRFGLAFH